MPGSASAAKRSESESTVSLDAMGVCGDTAMSVAFLGEQFFSYHAAGLAMVIGGIWLVQRQAARPARVPVETS